MTIEENEVQSSPGSPQEARSKSTRSKSTRSKNPKSPQEEQAANDQESPQDPELENLIAEAHK